MTLAPCLLLGEAAFTQVTGYSVRRNFQEEKLKKKERERDGQDRDENDKDPERERDRERDGDREDRFRRPRFDVLIHIVCGVNI